MKATFLICCVLALALPGVVCTPEGGPMITVTEESLAIRVTEVEGGITIENLSDVDCMVHVRSPEGEQVFELAVGGIITVTGITKPIEVVAVSP